MATQRWLIPREGLYIDPIVSIIRKTLFHPIFTLFCLLLVQRDRVEAEAPYDKVVELITLASLLLYLNDWISTKSRNNWVVDDTWDWKREVVVVTGGSGGIGGGVALLTYKLGI